MRWLLALMLLAAGAVAVPAQAGRMWGEPVAVADPAPDYANAAVAADGSTVTAWTVDDDSPGGYSVFARAGRAAPVRVGSTGSEHVEVGAGPGGQGEVLWAATGPSGAVTTLAVIAQSGGTFSTPVTVGAGRPYALATNAAGDAAVLLQDTVVTSPTNFVVHNATAFRPAGGTFGATAALPDTLIGSFALSPTGETLVAMGLNGQDAPVLGLDFYSRVRDGALDGPVQLTSDGRNTALAGDAQGRVLAVWTLSDRTAFFTAVRSADGTWAPAVAKPLDAQEAGYGVGVSDAGAAVLAWRDVADPPPAFASPIAGALRASTGSLATGVFGKPAVLDSSPGSVPFVRTGADGTTVIASVDPAVKGARVVRRGGTGAFAAAQTAACDPGVTLRGIVGLTAAGDATLLDGSALSSDAASDPSGRLDCPRPVVARTPAPTASPSASPSPTPVASTPGVSRATYSKDPVVAGEPVTITTQVRQPDHRVVGDYRFDLDGNGRPDHATGSGSRVRYAFTAPGLAHWSLTTQQTANAGGTRADFTDRFTVDVFARPTLRVARSVRRRGVVRRGLPVRANAFTGAKRRTVTLAVRGHSRRLARRTVRLGARPKTVRLRLSARGRRVVGAHRRTPARISLLQGGRRLRTAATTVRR